MASDINLALILGVVTGVISSLITSAFRSVWRRTLEPWFEERVYKDAQIEGRWIGGVRYSDQDISEFIFSLERQSHRITGEMISTRSGIKYALDGEFRNMILTLTYTSTVPHAVDRGCFTFLLTKNGRVLDGKGAFYYSPEHRIETAPVTLSRENAEITAQ